MKNRKPIPRVISAKHMVSAALTLQSIANREDPEYVAINLGIVDFLNGYSRGAVSNIDVRELRSQTSHVLFYELKDLTNPVPLDIAYLKRLKSHLKNPSILVLRRIRRFLMTPHRMILSHLERYQSETRRLDLANMEVNREIKHCLETMQRYQAMTVLTRLLTRKLDILAKAVNAPQQTKWDFGLLEELFNDQHHLRFGAAQQWLENSFFKGKQEFLNKTIEQGLAMLDRKSETIYAQLEKLSGLSFGQNQKGCHWYGLTSSLHREESFIRVFDSDEKVTSCLTRATFFMVQANFSAEKFANQVEEAMANHVQEAGTNEEGTANQIENHASLQKLSEIYFTIDHCITQSGPGKGEVQTAIESDLANGVLNPIEGREAFEWAGHNKVRLQSLRLSVFRGIVALKEKHRELEISQAMQELILADAELEEEPQLVGSLIPMVPTREMRAELLNLTAELNRVPSQLLQGYYDLYLKIHTWIEFLEKMEIHQQIYLACRDFNDFEENLAQLQGTEEKLRKLRLDCEADWSRCFRNAAYYNVEPQLLEKSFRASHDHMLDNLRKLDYRDIQVESFRKLFDLALEMEADQIAAQLDGLFGLVHAVPGQVQLMHCLEDWEKTLTPADYEHKQLLIMKNEMELQDLIDDIRAALRDQMAGGEIVSRRLRFEVFSLADCYAENLRPLLNGLMRQLPKLTSSHEGERLMEGIQAVEAQVIQAQCVTRRGGQAELRLLELRRSRLLPGNFTELLKEDLKENFQELDNLLGDINVNLKSVRQHQNRFGADFDTELFNLTINLADYEQLKKIYTFVDNITMMDIKRFGLIYKAKNKLMEDLFTKAVKQPSLVPRNIARLVNRRVFKSFEESKKVPVALKIAILDEVPEILDVECQLLLRTLNFSSSTLIREKIVYGSLLEILRQANKAPPEQLVAIKRIWSSYMAKIKHYHPQNYPTIFQINKELLLKDAFTLVGEEP